MSEPAGTAGPATGPGPHPSPDAAPGTRDVADDELVVGRLGRAHGVKGLVSVQVRTDDAERRFAPGVVLRTDRLDVPQVRVTSARWHGERLLVGVEGVADRGGAEALRGALLLVEASSSTPLEDPEEYWDHQLVGLHARLADGTALGVVVEVVHLPGQSLLAVRGTGTTPATGGQEQGPAPVELLLPFVTAVVPVVDLASGEVVVDPPPGLLDLREERPA